MQSVSLRVEGLKSTIFEDVVFSRGHNVTTASGGSNRCDGTNFNQSVNPGNTPTATLDTAAKLAGFTWDGNSGFFDDFFITRIGPDQNDTERFWGILVNYNFTPVGGCQFQTRKNDKILFAFDAFNVKYFLKLEGPKLVKSGQTFILTVTDGMTGEALQGAVVSSSSGTTATTDALGHAQFSFQQHGVLSFKAERSESIRSNRWTVRVV